MKAIHILALGIAAMTVLSCGTSRKSQQYAQYPNYGGYQPQPYYGQAPYQGQVPQQQYQQYPPQQYQQQQQQQQQYQQYPPQQQYQQQYQQQQYPPQQYQQQYSRQGADESGYMEMAQSPIEKLANAVGTNEIRAYGSAEAGQEMMALNAARAQAIAALQEKIEVYVQSGMDQYAQGTGVNHEYALDESTRNKVMTAVKGVVNGATVLDTRKLYNPNTKRFKYEVCVKYDRAGILHTMQQQSERIRANEKQFEQDMQSAWDALDASNNRMTLGEQQQQRQNAMQQNNLDRQHQRDMQYQNQQNQYNIDSQKVQNQYNIESQKVQNQYNIENQKNQNQYNLEQQKLQQQQQQNTNQSQTNGYE
jgi:hypothetical protein